MRLVAGVRDRNFSPPGKTCPASTASLKHIGRWKNTRSTEDLHENLNFVVTIIKI